MRNIVLIEPEDCGRDFAPYGHPAPSPNIDRLADEGMMFRQAFAESPMCSPSRAAMLTGTPSHENGMFTVSHRGFDLHRPERHLAGWLARRGYETVLAGQQHESHNDARGLSRAEDATVTLGYTRVLEPEPAEEDQRVVHGRTRADFANSRAAAAFLREPRDTPFFLSVGLWNAHRHFSDPREAGVNPDRVRPPATVPDNAASREDAAGYHALLGYVDRCVGMILDALRESGRIEDTLVVFTVDHGAPFRAMKTTLYDTGIGVALILRFPEGHGRGTASDALVSHLDLFPTLCDYLGLDPPEWLRGHSLMPVVRGETEEVNDAIFAGHNYATGALDRYDLKRCVRTRRYKYLWLMPDPLHPGEGEDDLGPDSGARNEPAKGWANHERRLAGLGDGEALFDLELDPMERVNVAEHPAYASVRQTLARRLRDYLERTGDPALRGEVPPPPNARGG